MWLKLDAIRDPRCWRECAKKVHPRRGISMRDSLMLKLAGALKIVEREKREGVEEQSAFLLVLLLV